MLDESSFEFRFGVFFLEVENFQNERIFDRFFGPDRVAWLRRRCLFKHSGLISRERETLIELTSDLAL